MPSSYAIGSHFENMIKTKVESGRYTSASEVIREALRLFEEHEEIRIAQLQRLKTQIQEGKDSGVGIPADKVLSRLEAKYSALEAKKEAL